MKNVARGLLQGACVLHLRARLCRAPGSVALRALIIGLAGPMLATIALPRTARACGPTPQGSWTIVDTWPAQGQVGVAVDAALRIRTRAVGVYAQSQRPFPDNAARLEVRVADSQGVEAPGRTSPFAGATTVNALIAADYDVGLWLPSQPLAANSAYTAHIVVRNTVEPPADAEGASELELAFTTGDEGLPAFQVSTMGVHLREGRRQTFALLLHDRGEDYTACVQLRVRDAAGHVVDWTGPCMPRADILASAPAPDVSA
jgi:hypothetical protein